MDNRDEFTFPAMKYGRFAIPWDLRAYLYEGGASADRKIVKEMISTCMLGPLLEARIPLVAAIHDRINGFLVSGGTHSTVTRQLVEVRRFFQWIDATSKEATIASVAGCFLSWAEVQLQLCKAGKGITEKSLYQSVTTLAKILDDILDRNHGLIHFTKVLKPRAEVVRSSEDVDRQKADVLKCCLALIDICNALTSEKIFGSLPITIEFRDGKKLEEWSALRPPQTLKAFAKGGCRSTRATERSRLAYENDKTFRTRSSIINLRVQAELLVFISQTSMNLAQAYKLTASRFRYRSDLDGYEVRRVYKNRRHGDVEFKIFSAYRPHLERYLQWRNEIFGDDESERLFPLKSHAQRSENIAPEFDAIEKRCQKLGIVYTGPRILRRVRLNVLYRETKNAAVTADMGQHSEDTLIRNYVQPSRSLAAREITRFHLLTDPAFVPPGPGSCVKVEPLRDRASPVEAPEPDCRNASGCLFCVHQRDIDSPDHMWSLVSYRHLKSIELLGYRSPELIVSNAIQSVIDRLSSKLQNIESSNSERSEWIVEAREKVREGRFHPQWDGFIQLYEKSYEHQP
ncbi:MAG: site-specific integrase [Pseudomonadota bacterium]